MSDEAWNDQAARCLGFRLAGRALQETDEMGEPLLGDTLFIMLNSYHEAVIFDLPAHDEGTRWERLLDTAETHWGRRYFLRDGKYRLRGRSTVLLRLAGSR